MTEFSLQDARTWYNDDDPVHDFAHIERVFHMATRLAMKEKANLRIVQTAALLHDAEGSAPGKDKSARAKHHLDSAEFAKQILESAGWTADDISAVQHCIRAHRFRSGLEEPSTIEAKVLFDADKLDVLGAVGAARTIAYAVLDHMPVYSEVSQHFVDTGKEEPGEKHSSYHEYIFKLRKVKDRLYTPSAIEIAKDRHAFLEEFYEQLRKEMRSEV